MRAGPGTNFGDESDGSGTSFADVTLQLLPPGRVERTLRRLTEDGLPAGPAPSREMTTSWTVLPSGGSLSREMTANWTVLPSGGSAPSREMLVRDGQPFSVRFRGNIRCDDARSVSRPRENFNLVT